MFWSNLRARFFGVAVGSLALAVNCLVGAVPVQAAIADGTVTLPVGTPIDIEFYPWAKTPDGMVFMPNAYAGSSWLIDHVSLSAKPLPHVLPTQSCASGTVLSERIQSRLTFWVDTATGEHGERPTERGWDYESPAPDGWIERQTETGVLRLVHPDGNTRTLVTPAAGSRVRVDSCDATGFAGSQSFPDRVSLVIGDFVTGALRVVTTEQKSLTRTGSFAPLAISGDVVVYQQIGWNQPSQVRRQQLGADPVSLGWFDQIMDTAIGAEGTAYVLNDTDRDSMCELVVQLLAGSKSSHLVGCAEAKYGALHRPTVKLDWVPGVGLRAGIFGTSKAGLYDVTPTGLSLVARLVEPVSAGAVLLSPGRATTANLSEPGIWARPLSGPPLTVGTAAQLSTDGWPYGVSGRRTVLYVSGYYRYAIVDGDMRTDAWLDRVRAMSGHRILTLDGVVNLTGPGDGFDLDYYGMAIWGDHAYALSQMGDFIQAVGLGDASEFWLSRAELGLAERTDITSVAAHSDTLAWSWEAPDDSVGIAWMDLRTEQIRRPVEGTPRVSQVEGVWGHYLLATYVDSSASRLVLVLDVRDGTEVFRIEPTPGPDGVDVVNALGSQGIAWTSWSGRTHVTPLPDQHLPPRHEGNPFAPKQFVLGTGTGMWTGEWVFTEPLTSCSARITDAAGQLVKTVACDARYAAQGEAVVRWSGFDTAGQLVPSGTYTCVLTAGDVDGPAVDVDGTSTSFAATFEVSRGAAYVPLPPGRVLDTRPGFSTVDGKSVGSGPVGPGGSVRVPVLGRAGVPVSGVEAVTVNVTGVAPTTATFLTAYPHGQAVPNASTLNLLAGQVYANSAVVKVGAEGAIRVFNAAGRANVVVDVTGYYPIGGSYVALTPARLTDTRAGQPTVDGAQSGGGKLGPGTWRDVSVAGRAGVPATGVAAVVVNVTGVAPSAFTYLTAYPSGTATPQASTQNLAPGAVVPNMAVVKMGANGSIRVFNAAGTSDVVVDVLGYIPQGTSYVPVNPTRILDTRTNSPVGASGKTTVSVAGGVGTQVPAGAIGVVVNLTGVAPTKYTFLSVYPAKTALTNVSTLNLPSGDVRANAAYVKLSDLGNLEIYNAAGRTHVVLDVVGYFK